jgi:hypothetical protein
MSIHDAPRIVEIEVCKVTNKEGRIEARPIRIAKGQKVDWENISTGLITISSELAARWPRGAQPDSIAIITDGRHLWFNPGRPGGKASEWLDSHISGESPCAMIHSSGEIIPFSPSWFEFY